MLLLLLHLALSSSVDDEVSVAGIKLLLRPGTWWLVEIVLVLSFESGGVEFLKSEQVILGEAAALELRGRWVWGSMPLLISLRLMCVFQ